MTNFYGKNYFQHQLEVSLSSFSSDRLFGPLIVRKKSFFRKIMFQVFIGENVRLQYFDTRVREIRRKKLETR